jgi:hypothetical protein
MYYVCIENNLIIGIQNFEPNVPNTVTVSAISDEQYEKIKNQTHRFDINLNTIVPEDLSILNNKERERLNGAEREFLNSTDWKILRHIRQKALNTTTTLTEAEYIALEQQRNDAAARIV